MNLASVSKHNFLLTNWNAIKHASDVNCCLKWITVKKKQKILFSSILPALIEAEILLITSRLLFKPNSPLQLICWAGQSSGRCVCCGSCGWANPLKTSRGSLAPAGRLQVRWTITHIQTRQYWPLWCIYSYYCRICLSQASYVCTLAYRVINSRCTVACRVTCRAEPFHHSGERSID